MPVFLEGLSLQFYRGIGPEKQRMAPFKEFNFFIGANNSGKSAVLKFISEHLPISSENDYQKIGADSLDAYRGEVTGNVAVEFAVSTKSFVAKALPDGEKKQSACSLFLEHIAADFADDNYIWLVSSGQPKITIKLSEPKTEDALSNLELEFHTNPSLERSQDSLINTNYWYKIGTTYLPDTLRLSWNMEPHSETLKSVLQRQNITPPNTQIIPTMRQIGPKGDALNDLSGKGLIDRLAEIQSPDHNKRDDVKIFERINLFLQQVTDKPEARIEIPHHRGHVLVHMDNKVLPLSSLGTGIHEVIMIAAFCTLRDYEIICIEEPEIHLHPILQRKLIQYLKSNTQNQYFIATHSAAFIDTPDAAVFHVSNDGNQTYIKNVTLRSEKHGICMDLGYKASDIMQANAVIWVEGPSERIYLKHWISAVAPELKEGIHYSLMFYGGRLLNHLSAEADEVEAFIDLRALNQNLAIVMDSDKDKARGRINDTKKRIKEEFLHAKGISWITKGREIENYVEPETLHRALEAAHPALYGKPDKTGQYDHSFYFKKKTGGIHKTANKVKVARIVCEEKANLDVLDLKQRINDLVKMIKRANGIGSPN